METLPAYLEKHPLPENVRIDGCTVLETSGVGSLETLKTLKHSNITSSAAPSSASPAAATSSAPASSFTPSHTATCNTQADFARIRSELRAYGVDRFQADMIHAGWFVRTEAGQVELATEGPKFNPYAKLVSGKLAAPYGNLLAQHSLHSADAQFFVAQNRPELDAAWASSEPDMVGKASMAQRHQFLLVKSLSWEVFNVAAFGINGDVQSLKQAIKLLDDMQETAIQYTRKAGWSSSLGLFFHCFPLNSVQALHLHMIDMEVRGPTFANLEYKNLPLEAVRAQLVEELAAVESKQQQRKHRSVYLHFGVHDGSQTFKVESTAYNCADFRVPDQRNWQPRNALIQPQCPAEVKTELDVHSIVKHLTKPKQDGAEGAWKCIVSEDPGPLPSVA
jgi:hypothetical protein